MAAAFLIHGGGVGGSFLKLKKRSHPILGLRPLSPPSAKNMKFNSLNYMKNHDSAESLSHSKSITPILRLFSNTTKLSADQSRNQQPLQAIDSLVKRALRKSAVAALLVLGLLVMNKSNCALAASMGRVGGSWSRYSSFTQNGGVVSHEGNEDPADAILCFYFLLSIIFAGKLGWNVLFEGEEIGYRVLLVFIGIWLIAGVVVYNDCQTRVARIQVCMSDRGGLLQSDLNRIAETADTCSRKGLTYVLDETLLALIRHQRGYLSHTSSRFTMFLPKPARRYMQVLSSNERMFSEETLVNFNNMKSKSSPSAIESHNDQITVTILLTFDSGIPVHLPSNDDSDALMKWMKSRLESREKLLAVEVLWTPQVSSSAANWQTVVNYPSQSEVPRV